MDGMARADSSDRTFCIYLSMCVVSSGTYRYAIAWAGWL
jgi:hypothetical protein